MIKNKKTFRKLNTRKNRKVRKTRKLVKGGINIKIPFLLTLVSLLGKNAKPNNSKQGSVMGSLRHPSSRIDTTVSHFDLHGPEDSFKLVGKIAQSLDERSSTDSTSYVGIPKSQSINLSSKSLKKHSSPSEVAAPLDEDLHEKVKHMPEVKKSSRFNIRKILEIPKIFKKISKLKIPKLIGLVKSLYQTHVSKKLFKEQKEILDKIHTIDDDRIIWILKDGVYYPTVETHGALKLLTTLATSAFSTGGIIESEDFEGTKQFLDFLQYLEETFGIMSDNNAIHIFEFLVSIFEKTGTLTDNIASLKDGIKIISIIEHHQQEASWKYLARRKDNLQIKRISERDMERMKEEVLRKMTEDEIRMLSQGI